mmetsp:Transcript_32226/g.67784  ORF Transcript_32226/g.67784 Transcript_32226/m.67784 type:complete len:80 (+) Transcript_32226:570-809(+)
MPCLLMLILLMPGWIRGEKNAAAVANNSPNNTTNKDKQQRTPVKVKINNPANNNNTPRSLLGAIIHPQRKTRQPLWQNN